MDDKNISNKALMILLGRSVPTPTLDSFEGILNMPLSEFKRAGLLVRVQCGHLNDEDVFIASTEQEAETGRAEGLITYTADELIELIKGKPSLDELRQIHTMKKEFGGRLIATKDKGTA